VIIVTSDGTYADDFVSDTLSIGSMSKVNTLTKKIATSGSERIKFQKRSREVIRMNRTKSSSAIAATSELVADD